MNTLPMNIFFIKYEYAFIKLNIFCNIKSAKILKIQISKRSFTQTHYNQIFDKGCIYLEELT